MRRIDKLIIHCADTPDGDDRYTATDIHRWHVEENGWSDIGYHYVIHVGGQVIDGRPLSITGAHCKGENKGSVGVCLIGRSAFTPAQWDALYGLIFELNRKAGKELVIHGHNEFDSGKTCPGFDVQEWVRNGFAPKPQHIWSEDGGDREESGIDASA